MTIKQGIGIYLGPDGQYHFDKSIDAITPEIANQIFCVLKSMNFEINWKEFELSGFDVPLNAMIQIVNEINQMVFQGEWPYDEWMSITDKKTGEVFDLNFWIDSVYLQKMRGSIEKEEFKIARATVYKTSPDENNPGLLKTETSNFRTVYAMFLEEEKTNVSIA